MKMKFNDIDLKTTYNKNHFALKDNMETAVVDENVKVVGKIDDVIYQCICLKTPNSLILSVLLKKMGKELFRRFQEIRHLC